MVEQALAGWTLEDIDFLFIENVGNLVCPSSFDLGEELRLVLVSTTEGEDKPLKYPIIFNSIDVAVITKLDLASAVGCELETLVGNIHGVRPGMPVLQVSTRSGLGIQELEQFLVADRTKPSTSGLKLAEVFQFCKLIHFIYRRAYSISDTNPAKNSFILIYAEQPCAPSQ